MLEINYSRALREYNNGRDVYYYCWETRSYDTYSCLEDMETDYDNGEEFFIQGADTLGF